ncbi:hypothetical protein Clacol_009086 [Clathrus columnatus]|uniref:Uncharacterized protein n=1 Tax=Clathrus columnatus TaxID=1419009 RepID=A0AAV5AQ62_9AGAM|nr:hypothetical protein Clacol_009086 [Clathrus columnatus]
MSLPPPLPPHPNPSHRVSQQSVNSKPPLPPLPPDYQPDSQTHPLFAPMPERIMPSLPADITRTLDDAALTTPAMSSYQYQQQQQSYPPPHTVYQHPHSHPSRTASFQSYGDPYRGPSTPQPPPNLSGAGYPGGFARPDSTYNPNRARTPVAPYAPLQGSSGLGPVPGGFVPPAGYGAPPPPQSGPAFYPPPHHHQQQQQQQQQQQFHAPYTASNLPSAMENLSINPSTSQPKPPELTAPIPTVEKLLNAQRTLPHNPTAQTHLLWIRDTFFVIERLNPPSETGVISVTDAAQRGLITNAAHALLAICSAPNPPPEALFLRGILYSTGCAPDVSPRSPREAFRDFEAAARGGWAKAWFKLGRDYETVGDIARARDCFERGMRANIESCYYRMGMARLLGQLGLPASYNDALPLLHKAATLATIETPQPAYVYGLLLLGEFAQVQVPENVFFALALIPPGTNALTEARKYIEKAAYLGFAPAQYKLGHAYEYAIAPFEADPLLSVQWYSLASQQGEAEADMALSKWFLCGAEGAFEKDENLAFVFAEKAASKALPSAEFALGYYAEVGIGMHKDVEVAKAWYEKAIAHGNPDAPDRLAALSQPSPHALSRTEHEKITDDRLVRRRSQAKATAEAAGRIGTSNGRNDVLSTVRAQSGMPAIGEEPDQPPPPPPHHSQPQPQPQQRQPLRQSPGPIPGGPAPTSPSHTPAPSHTPPSHAHTLGPPTGQGAAGQHPRQFSELKRYTLTDGRPVDYGGSPPPQQPYAPTSGSGIQPGRAAGRPPGRRHGHENGPIPAPNQGNTGGAPGIQPVLEQPPPPPPAARPHAATTFAELGFQAGKAQDKDCIIM